MRRTPSIGRRLTILAVVILTTTGVTAIPATAHRPVHDGLIAFTNWTQGPSIYTIRPDGSGLRLLTTGGQRGHSADPSWSHNGRVIVFTSDVSGSDRIYTMAADGTHQRRLFDDLPGFNDDVPAYLPNGQGFVFARCHNEGCALASVRADGTGLRMLTAQHDGVVDYFLSVSRTGRVVFTRFNANGIQAQIYVLGARGQTHPVTPQYQGARVPRWSPDGRRIAFSGCCLLNRNIYTIAANGAGLVQLTHTPYPYLSENPAYSPTATRIVFTSNRKHADLCCSDLYLMSANGHHQRLLHTGLTDITRPVWAPAADS